MLAHKLLDLANKLDDEADEILGDVEDRDENTFDLEGEADEDLAQREADTLRSVAERIRELAS